MVLIDYWIAGQIGRRWLWWRGREAGASAAEACLTIARGGQVSTRDLLSAQAFAVGMWILVGVLDLLMFLVVVGLLIVVFMLFPGITWRRSLVPILVILGYGIPLAAGVMKTIDYRWARTRNYLRRSPTKAAGKPMPHGRGTPRKRDFWVMLAIVVVTGALYHA